MKILSKIQLNKKISARKSSQKGVTLIEILVSMTLLALVLTIMFRLFSSSGSTSMDIEFSGKAAKEAKALFRYFEKDIRSAKRVWASDENTLNMICLGEDKQGRIAETEIKYARTIEGVQRITGSTERTFQFVYKKLPESSFEYSCFISTAGQLVIELKYSLTQKKPEVSISRHFRLP